MTQLLESPVKRQPKRWTKQEYYAATEKGFFDKQRVYLYHGELIQMPAMGALHARSISKVTVWAVRNFDPELAVRCQLPFDMPDHTVPEPDFVIATQAQQARSPHPNAAELVIEISDSSVELDQDMATEYAAAGVPEYWIVDVRDHQVEVFRELATDKTSRTGVRYRSHKVHSEGESIAPLVKPALTVAVALLMP